MIYSTQMRETVVVKGPFALYNLKILVEVLT